MPGPDAAYVYNWNSLVGCLQGLLRQAGLPSGGAQVSVVSGEAFRVEPVFDRAGYVPRPLAGLSRDLAALGLRARVDVWGLARRRLPLLRWRLERRVRGALSGGRAVAAYGAVPGEFGLIVAYEVQRRAYVVQGPLTDAIGGLLPAAGLPGPAADWLALVAPQGPGLEPAGSDDLARRAAAQALQAGAAAGLRRWIALLESGAPIEARVHAYRAQALAAARGEASRFWRELADSPLGEMETRPLAALREPARRQALVSSRFATLFPYPAGGDLAGGGRIVGAGILREVLAIEEELAPLLAAVRAPG